MMSIYALYSEGQFLSSTEYSAYLQEKDEELLKFLVLFS